MPDDKFSEVILILISSTVLILFLGAIIIFSLLINQKRKFSHRNALAEMKNSYEKEILQSQLEIQLQTFENISRELHDNVGIVLSIAMVHLNAIPEPTGQEQKGKLKEIKTLIDEAIDTLRDISKSLSPENINRTGLRQAIASELEKAEKTGLFKVQLDTRGEEFAIEPQRQIILYRIVQEIINNALKHSGCTQMSAVINFSGDSLTLRFADNGKGFDFNEPNNTTGSGLKNMSARCKMIGAGLTIESQTGQGTVVTILYNKNNTLHDL